MPDTLATAAVLPTPPSTADSFALSSVQEVVWFDQMRQPQSPVYNIGLAWRIGAPVDAVLFERAINLAAASHDALRLVLCPGPGVARQRVLPEVVVPVPLIDFSQHEDGDARAMAYLEQRFAAPFDLEAGLLWEAALVRASATHCYWLSRYHHLVTDGFGTALLLQAVAANYNALAAGGPVPDPAAPSYREFVADDQAYAESARQERDCQFWRERFARIPEALIARPPGAPTTAGPSARARWAVPRVLFDRLSAFASAEGLSITHLMLAAVSAWFARTTGAEEVVIGVSVHNRSNGRQKQTIGMFSSVSPIGIRVDQEQTLAQLMHEAAAELKRCYRHQRLPLARINREVRLAASGRSQLFDITVSPISISGDGHLGEGAARVVSISTGVENTPLAIFIRDHHADGEVMIDFDTNTYFLDAAAGAAIRTGVATMLHDALARPQAPLSQLALLTAEQRELLLHGWNDSAMAYPDSSLIHELFEQLAATQPDALALVSDTASLTYAQLNGRANTLAERLRAIGIAPDQRVAICVERGVEMVIGLLGVLKAGGAYVPLDPAYPPERLAYMLADSEPVALLTQSALAAQLPPHAILLDAPDLAAQDTPNPVRAPLTPDNLAYVIYTSGSTGLPKGVMNRHGGLCNLVTAQQALFGNGPGARVLQFASFSFDASVWEMVMAVCSGAALHLAPRDALRPGEPLLRTLQERAITHVTLPSSAVSLWDDPEALAPMTLIVAGDACPPALAAAWSTRHRFVNAYGPTETTVCATAYRCSPGHQGPVPIGKPIANTRIYIVDRHLQLAAVGAVGEICIAGAPVARGYLNRPELSAERFVADPFGDGSMYRTGDMGRWLPDGNIEFLGRNDFQVKIRGFRIELGEVEAALAACPGVREAVVVAREDQPGAKRLVAYLIAHDGADLQAAQLRAALAQTLAEHMLPAAFVTLDAFPLSGNGKLDRKALPAPGMDAVITRAWAAPQGELETTLAAIWQELLGLERIGRDDHFFELGGHSLMATQVVSTVQQRLGIAVGLRTLFAQPCLADFAAAVRAAGAELQSPIVPVARATALPLSFSQQRLWFLDRLDHAASVAYHMPAALRLRGQLDHAALQATLSRIVARHENLRTRFVDQDGHPAAIVSPSDCGCALPLIDLSTLAPAAREADLAARQQAEAIAPFDLAAGPLMRAALLRMDQDDHVLLLTQHHIVSDAWSAEVLVGEIGTLYAAFLEGRPDPLPPLAIQYADYAAWQRGHLQGGVLERQLGFWRRHLDGAPALLALPTDRPRPATQSYAGARVPLQFDAHLSAAIKALGQRHGSTLFMTLMAGWSLLLARLSGQHDVVVGVPVANRERGEVAALTGLFVNTLAMRVQPDMQASVADLIAQVRSNAEQAYQHQDVPFEQVVDAVQPQRSMSHSPLFQVVLNMEASGIVEALRLPGLELAVLPTPHASSHFDLSLSLCESGGTIGGSIEYASDLFDRSTVDRMAAQLTEVLAAMARDDSQIAGRVALLDGAARSALLDGFNDTARPYPSHKLIHKLFEQQVAQDPTAIALVAGERRISYVDLNLRANRVAHYLLGQGVHPDQPVAICAERGVSLIVGLLGILKAGGCYVPLDPDCPPERMAFILDDCAPVAVLAEAACMTLLPALTVPVLNLDTSNEVLACAGHGNPCNAARGLASHHLANIIYTSGSTGQPKGVMVEHRNVVQLVINEPCVAIGPRDRIVYCANPAFDASTWEIWGGLLNGATVLVIDQATLLDPQVLARVLTRERATILQLTVGLFTQYAQALADVFPRLDYLLFGGDQANLRTVARVFDETPPRHLVHTYGPTETTTFTSTFEVRRALGQAATLPIGRPIANTRIYVLDPHGEPVPPGVTGELYIGGAGVARGYLKRPDLNAEKFIADPFSADSGARLYRTGDLGRWLADGNIEFLGRNDFQVKIRGFRIELGEIEARLAACDGVHEAVVLARTDAAGDKQLVAYLIPGPGAQLSAGALRAALSANLAEYMLPSAFVMLDSYPLTPNGKLDRKALPSPDLAARDSAVYEAPRDGIESVVAQVWSQLLSLARVGRHDDFFRLGGHSLMAVRLMSRLREQCGVELGLRELFAEPTLAGFAGLVAGAARAAGERIPAANRSAPLALSFAQQRLWFLDQLDHAASAAYHMPAALRLSGKLDAGALTAALDHLVARHDVLRTTFRNSGGEPAQVIAAAGGGFALTRRDLSSLPGNEQQARLELVCTDEASQPFDLADGPLIRGQLLHLGPDEHVLLITQHHIISDGWSGTILVRELGALYGAFARGLPAPLPPLAIQYADYAAWQRGWLQGERLERQVGFWKTHLQGAPALLELPADRPRPARQSYAGGKVPIVFDAALAAGLRELGQRHGATLFMTLLAGWSTLLARLSGQGEVVVGTPVANRQHGDVEGLIGFFANTLALRVRLGDDPTVASLLAQVRAATLAACEHQDLPFEQVVEALQPVRSMSHSPVFQALLSVSSATAGDAFSLAGLDVQCIEQHHATTHFDLSLQVSDDGITIAGMLEYASDLFEEATAARFAVHLDCVLRAMVANEHAPASQLALLDAGQRHQVLHEFNDSAAPYADASLIHQLFEALAARQPDAVALVTEQGALTYADLNGRANTLAARLAALGVAPDQCVAICVERGIEMVVGLLGVLKSGGAYVPLDPSYPPERLAYMLADSAPVALLTQAALAGHVPAQDVPLILLDSPDLVRATPANPAAAGVGPDNLAYVIYTSGSTGQPKGVMNRHQGLCNLVAAQQALFGNGPGSRVLQFASFSFDASVWEMVMALCSGAELHLAARDALRPGAPLLETLQQRAITHVTLPSSALALWDDPEALAPMTLIVAGDACAPALASAWASRHRFFNAYGPTETTVCATAYRCHAGHQGVLPIGKPIANARIYILDGHLQPVALGAVGEICIGGVPVARGYLNRPELTAERFVADPFGGERLYRTGDLGRWLADGNVEFLGRNDFQVKIRGFRIELGEVEAALAACAGVREAAVVACADQNGDKRLVAYLIAHDGAEPAAAELREAMAASLADYMLPSAFVTLAAWPLSPNGKLDRKALPAPGMGAVAARAYCAPQGEQELAVAAAWQELMGLERVGRDDHFFELGGHSLMAVRLLARIREQCLVELPLRALFEAPVLKDLAALVMSLQFKQFMATDVDAMDDALDALSDDELMALLAEEGTEAR